MVFPSDPIYLDPPNSWPQQQGATCETPQVPPPPRLPHGSGDGGDGGSANSIKPRSMAERARLAKILQPEAALKCPRCESNNTKFCYFNNYSLSQPRHFCKTCRRYWTRGGALRSVPVGGGCRRNKRIKGKGSRSKSPAKGAGCTSISTGLASNSCPKDIIGHMAPPPLQVPILPPLQNLGGYNSTEIGLNFTRIQPPTGMNVGGMEFNIGSTSSSSGGGVVGSNLSNGLVEQWRLQQMPLFANLELQSGGLYQFGGQGIDHPSQNYFGQHRSNKPLDTLVTQLSTVKLEANHGLNLSRNLMGIAGNDQYWGANAWSAELPGFTSSSTTNLL